MPARHTLVFGATGLVGHAAARHLAALPEGRVTAVSRRRPDGLDGVEHLALDLTDAAACRAALAARRDVTHVVYTALYERPQLVAGWLEADQIQTNDRMLRNALGPLLDAPALRHVTLLQGAKAYGVHVRLGAVPAREDRDEARDVPNFYWVQQDWLAEQAASRAWSYTVLRPPLIVGYALGAAMSVVPTLGVYAALLREAGEPLYLPADSQGLIEALDADVLAEAIAWSGEAPGAAGQAFNVTNGDVMSWAGVWPAIAEAFGMRPGPLRPISFVEALASRAADWDALRARHGLVSPGLEAFVGLGPQYADLLFAATREPGLLRMSLSTIKLRRAGFAGCADSEQMWRRWIGHFRAAKLLP